MNIRAAGGWWPRPLTSAMVVPRAFLARIGPIPESEIPGRVCWPDAYAGDLAPFLGEIRGIPDCLTHYRVHGRNQSLTNPELRAHQELSKSSSSRRCSGAWARPRSSCHSNDTWGSPGPPPPRTRVGQSPRSLARPSLPNSRRPGANPRGCASSARRFPAQSGIRQWACLKVARSPSPRPPWGRAAAVAWPRVLGTALALLAFLIPVRGRVIGFVPGNFTGWRAYVELLAGATYDGMLVVTAVVVALTATLVGGRRWGSATVWAFNAFAVVALGAAVANVEVVAKLGGRSRSSGFTTPSSSAAWTRAKLWRPRCLLRSSGVWSPPPRHCWRSGFSPAG